MAALATHSRAYDAFDKNDERMLQYFGGDETKFQAFLKQRHTYEKHTKSLEYFAAVEQADAAARRVKQLIATHQIPPAGALSLLNNDPMTQGPRLFKLHCASCHNYEGPADSDSVRIVSDRVQVPEIIIDKPANDDLLVRRNKAGQILWQPNGGPNLYGFASRDWIRGLLNPEKFSELKTAEFGPENLKSEKAADHRREVTSAPYFGNTAHRFGSMSEYLRDPDGFGLLTNDEVNKIVIALSAQAELPAQRELDRKAREAGTIASGEKLIASDSNCAQCHHFGNGSYEPDGVPDLAGYGSRQWLIDFISNPAHGRFYGEENDRMPEFAKDPKDPKANLLTRQQIEMIVDWLRGDDSIANPAAP